MSKLYKCTCCNKMKQPFEFHVRKDRKKGITSKCKLCISKEMGVYYKNNVETILIKKEQYREANRETINIKQNEDRLNNLEAHREYDRNYHVVYKENNPSVFAEKSAKRRAQKSQALPIWLSDTDRSKIKSIYKMCKSISFKTSIEHHVDHIVPLINKDVCGLHVPWNLRIITQEENLKKSNNIVEDIV